MKKKELKKLVKKLEKENAELRITRAKQIDDIRKLLSNNHFDKAQVGMKYNLLWDTEKMMWSGDTSKLMQCNGILDLIAKDK